MQSSRRGPSGAIRAALFLCAVVAKQSLAAPPAAVAFEGEGRTTYGDWLAEVEVTPSAWRPGDTLRVNVTLRLSAEHLPEMARKKLPSAEVVALATVERTFDSDGWMRLPSDERMSTLLTPGRLPIEGGVQGAVTDRFGYPFRSPFDVLRAVPAGSVKRDDSGLAVARFALSAKLPGDLPPGLYRVRLDFGTRSGSPYVNLNGYAFTLRPFTDQAGTDCYVYSPGLFPASGVHVSGEEVDGTALRPRVPWTLLSGYGSNGYRGVVADEDRDRFAISDRNIIHDEVVLPLYDDRGAKLAYSLEPQVLPDGIDPRAALAWDPGKGELSLTIHAPDGSVTHVGTAPFVAKSGLGMTTKSTKFSAWKPPMYGLYAVEARGWMADRTGRRYEGGGTYRFWIAKRMTMATATFQGMPYPVGARYGRDIGFAPAVPADVTIAATLYPGSDRTAAKEVTCTGKASSAGVFGAAQGMKQLPLDAPGEYHAQVLATYTDADGHLWVCVMRHAGVVYAEDSPIEAHGKKLLVGKAYVERGETHDEGFSIPDGEKHLAHITFPYRPGDVLLVASEGQGSNKIEPVLTWDVKGAETPWDPKLQSVGVTNLRITTSNGYSPHLYPEYITRWEYYYGAGPRPGFMSRFLVGESNVRAPYWPTSPNSFGGQIGASANGDQPGDVYRLLGGVVRRPGAEPAEYAGYIASAFILPKGTNNNRVVAPGAEDVIGSLGETARFFLVGLRPGMAYETGSTFAPGLQIDPILPVAIRFTLRYPDGRTKTAEGTGDRFGSFAGTERWPLDVPGVYRYTIDAAWDGHCGGMPGLPPEGGEMYVYRKERPAGAKGLSVDLPNQSRFAPSDVLRIGGTSSARSVRYALITPGAVIEQGDLPVESGRFAYHLDPLAVHARVPLYDVVNLSTGKPEIGRVLHLTFFSEEKARTARRTTTSSG